MERQLLKDRGERGQSEPIENGIQQEKDSCSFRTDAVNTCRDVDDQAQFGRDQSVKRKFAAKNKVHHSRSRNCPHRNDGSEQQSPTHPSVNFGYKSSLYSCLM